MSKLIALYQNGNYTVKLYSDGTKVKTTKDDKFIASFPDSMDLKITDYCDMNCPMCHEKSSVNGKHGNLNEDFLSTLKRGTELAIGGGNPLSHPDLIPFLKRMKDQKIVVSMTVNQKHFERLLGLIQKDKVVFGGNSDSQAQRIEPTVMDNVLFSDPVMQEEIFGPIMPILTFENIDECVTKVQQMEHPLAFYIFTSNKKLADRVISLIGFGGGCINDTIIHLATTQMGFGGFGESGMGSYHGKVGFDTFSHYKSIVDKKTWMDLPMRYQPYQKIYDKMIRMFLK
jgi:organic radical activating enzyme